MHLVASGFIALMSTSILASAQLQHIKTGSLNKLQKRALPPYPFVNLGSNLIVKGLEASRQLLHGSKLRKVVGPVREFEKPGGLNQALTDFYRVQPTNVENFQTPTGIFVRTGKVGDRKIVLLREGDEGLPTVELTKLKVHDQSPDLPDQLLTDKIVYKDEYL